MGGCVGCGRDGDRRYLDRTTYVCVEYRHVGMADAHTPVFLPCETENVDEDAVAEIEAEEEEARLAARRAEHARVVHAVTSGAGPRVYCRNGNVAARRCADCDEDLCFDDECCGDRIDKVWYCDDCGRVQRRAAAQRAAVAEERRKSQEAARYRALPRPTPQEIADHLRSGHKTLTDGRTHRLDQCTYRDLARAMTLLHGRGGWTWKEALGGNRLLLDDDGVLRSTDSLTGAEPRVAGPADACTARLKGPAIRSEPLSRHRASQELAARKRRDEEAAARASERQVVAARQRRERARQAWTLAKPLLVVTPAVALVAAGVVSFRTGVSEAWFTQVRAPWVYLQIPVNLAAPPVGLFCALFGGFILAGGLPDKKAGERSTSLIFWVGAPVGAGLVYGSLIAYVPFLRHLAATPAADWLVSLFA